jgi:hypothetical protein
MKHKHAALIHAWADGAEIEWLGDDEKWHLVHSPAWGVDADYRIKQTVDPYAELKAAAADPTKEIRVSTSEHTGVWECGDNFDWFLPPRDYEIRDKPKPKKQVKLLAWFDGTTLFLRTEDCHYISCQRVPSEDKVIEVDVL